MDTAAYVGVTDPVLEQATNTLLDYLQGNAPSLDLAMDNGEEYYSQREKDHMVDVKALYQNAVLFMTVGFCAGGALFAGCFLWKRERALGTFLRCYFWAAVGVLALFACIGVWAAVDFNSFWVSFTICFYQRPVAARPGRITYDTHVPGGVFANMVARILAWFLSAAVGSAAAAGIVYQRMKNMEDLNILAIETSCDERRLQRLSGMAAKSFRRRFIRRSRSIRNTGASCRDRFAQPCEEASACRGSRRAARAVLNGSTRSE